VAAPPSCAETQSISNQLAQAPFRYPESAELHALVGNWCKCFQAPGSTPSASRTTLAVAGQTVSSSFNRGSPL
jgi:hypothetical protein